MSGVNPAIAPSKGSLLSCMAEHPGVRPSQLGASQLRAGQRLRGGTPWIWFGGMPLISVVIPVHGVEDYLDRCLDSVLSEPAVSLEVIAVDDASPDGSG